MSTNLAIRRTVYSVVGAVSLFAAANSYNHIYSLARSVGQDTLSAALLPLSVDGPILAASVVLLSRAREHRSAGALPYAVLLSGVLATLAANVACGLGHGIAGAIVSAWPALAFVGTVEMLMLVIRQDQPAPRSAPEAALRRGIIREPQAEPDAPRRAALDLVAAESAFAELLERGALPSIREIRARVHVGQDKGRLVLAHLQGVLEAAA